MKLAVGKESLRRFVSWVRRALYACAVVLLGYCAFAVVDAWVFQSRESSDLDRLMRVQPVVSEGTTPQSKPSATPKRPDAVVTNGLIGRIEIPRLLLSAVVCEGIEGSTLRRAVGHIPGTALPGQPGNVALAGHRDTFFRSLKDLQVKDEVEFSTLKGNFKYEVESLMVVEPDDLVALAPSSENVLTLVTCYPFSYIGTAPKRFVARARQVSPQAVALSSVE